jgi:predicted outer membrane repeat protein
MTRGTEAAKLLKRAALASSGIGFALAAPAVANAASTYTVQTTGDGAPVACSGTNCQTLRDAVAAATTTGDKIVFASGLSGTVPLASGIAISNSVGIYGPGFLSGPTPSHLPVTLSGGGSHRVFTVANSTVGLTITGLALTGGHAGSSAAGGAVNATSCTDVSFKYSEVTQSDSGTGGGGAVNAACNVFTDHSTFSGDHTTGDGGAIYATGFGAERSTFTGDHADVNGGAIASTSNAALLGSTVTGDTSSAPISAGGVAAFGVTQSSFDSSILFGNSPNSYTSHFTSYYSVFPAGTLATETHDIHSNPLLGPLQNNGGPTDTLLPAFNSPVIDQGKGGAPNDQRGFASPVDIASIPNAASSGNFPGTDIGAVELTAAEATAPLTPIANPFNLKRALKKCKKKKSHKARKKCIKKARKKAAAQP